MKILNACYTIEDNVNGDEILKRIESAGRTCYQSDWKITDSSHIPFVKHIMHRGHLSVLEHEKVTVRVICDRGVTHEIVRHRIASYSQESTRFCNYMQDRFGGEIKVIDPCFWPEDSKCYNVWHEAMLCAENYYLRLLELDKEEFEPHKLRAERARSVLPNSLKTEIVMTMNLREWRHFFALRTALAAHPQMREVACPMHEEFKKLIPIVYDWPLSPEEKLKAAQDLIIDLRNRFPQDDYDNINKIIEAAGFAA